MARFLNAQRLREDWPQLRVLVSNRMRRACERKLGLPARAAAISSASGRRRSGSPSHGSFARSPSDPTRGPTPAACARLMTCANT